MLQTKSHVEEHEKESCLFELFCVHADHLWIIARVDCGAMLSCFHAFMQYSELFVSSLGFRVVRFDRPSSFVNNKCLYKGWRRKRRLLLLSGGSAGAIDGLLNLTGNTILGSVELGANGAVLGERSTDLLLFVLV